MKKAIVLILVLLLSGIVLGDETFLGVFKTNEPINLIQTCSNCSYINITTVFAPDSSIIIENAVMDKTAFTYNYTLPGQSQTGAYQVCGIGDLDGINTVWCYAFDVTQSGNPNPENRTTAIILGFITTLVFFVVMGFMTFNSDLGKGSFWLSFICFGMSLLELVFMLGILFINEHNALMVNLLRINFYVVGLLSFGISMSVMILVQIRLISLNNADEKWGGKKW